MPTPITVPRLGWSMDEGRFVGWLKSSGQPVKAGEPLFTLEGDKAAQEVEAAEDGLLRIPPDAPQPGDTVRVGALLGYLDRPGEDAAAPAAASPNPAPRVSALPEPTPPPPPAAPAPAALTTPSASALPAPPTSSAAPSTPPRQAITPRARRRAAELGLDCRGLRGTGRFGRITEADVLAAAQVVSAPAASAMRRGIAQRTTESFGRVPHFYLRVEVDAGPLLELRARLLPGIEAATGVRLTLTDLLLRAQALALRDCPYANAIWRDDRVVQLSSRDVGLVVAVDDGLLVPVLRAADAGGLGALVQQRSALVAAARARTLPAEATRGGATSLSNLGNTGVDEFAAVIAAPQSSMLAVGGVASRPWVAEGQIAARSTLRLCLSVDHRVMDGGPAAKYLDRLRELLEHPAAFTGE